MSSNPDQPPTSAADPRGVEPSRSFRVYILQNPSGRFYIGHTGDLASRLENHSRSGDALGKYGPWELVWSEAHPTRSSATRREREIKSWKSARRVRQALLGQSLE